MRFSAVHKVASYLMVGAAFLALALSRELPPLVVALTAAGGALSFFAEPSRHALFRHRSWSTSWNALTLAAFAWTILDALRGEALFAGVRFLCFLLVNKLWNRRTSRDYLQAYVVSFLMLVAGAALSSELVYALCFLAYVVFATWTLTLFHLRREMEENYLLKHTGGEQSERVEVERILNSRRIIGGSFLAGTSLVSIGIFLGASVVFFLIPRFGFGFFVQQKRRGASTIGFSDRIELGEYGRIKDNPQVVMRVELPQGKPRLPLRLRGVTFDRYVHGKWSRTQAIRPEPVRGWGDVSLVAGDRGPIGRTRVNEVLKTALVQHVYLDPLDTAVLFGAPTPVAFQLPRALGGPGSRLVLEGRGAGEVAAVERHVDQATGRTYTTERKSGLRYTVYSDERTPPIGTLLTLPQADGDALRARPELAPYLALPPDLPPRIAALARQVTERHRGPWAKAHALELYLQNTLRYTLDLRRDERYEPLEDFLFVQKAGHCEYFASAMAVMLRSAGIPSRSVNGFLGGEWNQYGGYVAIRQGDAHSWVEAWIEGVGWMTFDPTPAGPGLQATSGLLTTMRQVLDTLELAWFKYVIEYDLNKQIDAVQGMRRWASTLSGGSRILGALERQRGPIAGLLAAGAAAWLLLRRRRRRARGLRTPASTRAHAAFQRALRALEKRGYPRGAAETGRELSARVSAGGDPAAPRFAELVELYYAVRFGDAAPPPGALERLADEVARPRESR